VIGRSHQEQPHSRQDEDQLRDYPDGGVHDHAGCRLHPRYPSQMDEANTRDIAADDDHRQQRIDGVTDPADPDDSDGPGDLQSVIARAMRDR